MLRGQLLGAKGNSRARKFETETIFLIGEMTTKRSVSDGQALTGCRVLEGVVARLSLVRPAPRSRGDDPDLAAGGPKRTERRGSTGRTMGGGSLNGPNQRLSHGPSTSQNATWVHAHAHPQGTHTAACPIQASVPPKGGLTVSPGSGVGHGEGILRERELSPTQHTDTQHESLDSNMATSIR